MAKKIEGGGGGFQEQAGGGEHRCREGVCKEGGGGLIIFLGAETPVKNLTPSSLHIESTDFSHTGGVPEESLKYHLELEPTDSQTEFYPA